MQLLELASLIVDFGLVVLTWIVQLVIYPSFRYYAVKDLKSWHLKYTRRITIVVFPLMISQLILHSYFAFENPAILAITTALLVVLNWLITFFFAVPLHGKIDTGQDPAYPIKQLIYLNWLRTGFWSLIMILTWIMIL
jgi:hypothetical protein